ncbi:transposase domain-containing protein [Haliea sp. E1-2-M8]
MMPATKSAKIHGLDPQVYLRDDLARLPSTLQSGLDDLLPHN